MTEQLFWLHFDSRDAEQWFLGAPVDHADQTLDPRIFTDCRRLGDLGPLRVPIQERGCPCAVSFGPFDLPIVTAHLGSLLVGAAPGDVELVPVNVEGERADYHILNVVTCLDCIDPDRTDGERWTIEDGRPEKIGQYSMIIDLKLDPGCVKGPRIFRVEGWEVVIAVTEDIRTLLERAGVSGARFDPLT